MIIMNIDYFALPLKSFKYFLQQMDYSLEKPKDSDLISLSELNQQYTPALGDISIDMMNYFINYTEYFKVLRINNNIIGFLIALLPEKDYRSQNYKWFNKRYKSFIYVDRVLVIKKYQNHGFGKIFYNDLIHFSSTIAQSIVCEVNIKPPNHQSVIFHKNFGFKEVGQQNTENGKKRVSLLKFDLKI